MEYRSDYFFNHQSYRWKLHRFDYGLGWMRGYDYCSHQSIFDAYSYFEQHDTGMTGSSISVSPATSTTYTVTMTDNCTIQPATTTVPVTIKPKPTVQFLPAPISGCTPVVANFTDQTIGTASNYNWNLGDGTTSLQ